MKKAFTYQIVGQKRQPAGHLMWELKHELNNKKTKTMLVGITKLRNMYEKGLIVGHMDNKVRAVLGRELKARKGRSPWKEATLIYSALNEIDAFHALSIKTEEMYSIPDVFEV